MIIGQEMAEIRHGGGGAVRSHFWSLCGVAGFLETAHWPKKFQHYLRVPILVAGRLRFGGACAVSYPRCFLSPGLYRERAPEKGTIT